MFDSLGTRLQDVFKTLRGDTRLTPEAIEAALREIRLALLEADVNFKVVKAFVDRVRDRAMGQDVLGSLSPAQQVVKIVRDEMLALFGDAEGGLQPTNKRPRVILLLGLQGAGKTTTAGKLAKWLVGQGRHPLLVSTDVKRPAAIEQLNVVGAKASVRVYDPPGELDPIARARGAVTEAGNLGFDVIIVDSAGRLHVDDELMTELVAIRDVTDATDRLYVADAMTGQDAIKSAGEFHHRVGVTGVVLSKLDGDARGGAALSVVSVVGVPIAFAGNGERLEDFEPFRPERVVSRVLGMGDVLSLIERAEAAIDRRRRGEARSEDPVERVHARRFSRSAADDPEDGAARSDHGHAARHGQHEGAGGEQAGREADVARRGHHRLDDAGRAAEAAHHQRQPAQAHCEGQRDVGRRSESSAEAVRADAEDVETARRDGRAGGRRESGTPPRHADAAQPRLESRCSRGFKRRDRRDRRDDKSTYRLRDLRDLCVRMRAAKQADGSEPRRQCRSE